MGKQTNEEKKFSDNIDRLLRGEEVTGVEDASEDYHTAINFAQKLIKLRDEPSSSFKDQLKQRLLLQLTRREVKAAREKERASSFWEFLKGMVPRSPMWRTAAATLVIVLVAVGVLWRTGMFPRTPVVTVEEQEVVAAVEKGTEEGAPAPAPAPARAVEMEAALQLPMEKVIEVNQTRTAGGLSITLERVELHAEGISFSAFTKPPDYSLPADSKSHPLEGLVPALAEYTVDGVTIQAGYSELTALEDGIRMTWGHGEAYLAPVPGDATEIIFAIISFGEWEGPWEFIIPLQD